MIWFYVLGAGASWTQYENYCRIKMHISTLSPVSLDFLHKAWRADHKGKSPWPGRSCGWSPPTINPLQARTVLQQAVWSTPFTFWSTSFLERKLMHFFCIFMKRIQRFWLALVTSLLGFVVVNQINWRQYNELKGGLLCPLKTHKPGQVPSLGFWFLSYMW